MKMIQLIAFAFLIASSNAFSQASTSMQSHRRHSTSLCYRDTPEVYTPDRATGMFKSSDFKNRMRNIVKRQQRTSWRPENMKTALTLTEYADIIEEGRKTDRVVVVNFHATWCKKCHSLRPAFTKMAATNPDTIYLDVPITETNANIHKGLGIETVPFCHVYHPEQGLVEETKISRETLSQFVGLVQKHCA